MREVLYHIIYYICGYTTFQLSVCPFAYLSVAIYFYVILTASS